MEVFAIQKNIPMSAQKMREVVRQIQGLPALQAQAVLAVVPRKGARFAAKTLKSAIANAENNNKLRPETLAHQGSRGRHGHHPQAFSTQGPRFRRSHSQAPLPHQNHFVRRIVYGSKNQSNRSARRGQQRLALQVVCRKEGIRQAVDGGPRDSRRCSRRSWRRPRCPRF